MKTIFLMLLTVIGCNVSIFGHVDDTTELDAQKMKARVYPLEWWGYENVRSKMNKVLKEGMHHDLGNNRFMRCDLDTCVAGRTEKGELKLAHIILYGAVKRGKYDYELDPEDKTEKVDQATLVGTTLHLRHDGRYENMMDKNYCQQTYDEDVELLKAVSSSLKSMGYKTSFICGRIETDFTLAKAGFSHGQFMSGSDFFEEKSRELFQKKNDRNS